MYVGNKNHIDVTSSQFVDFIKEGNLYVDKTMFIEHILEDRNKVLLFTRPRRMGKSLNMNTLATFLDCKQTTAHLFSGLYIERSEKFCEVNKYPVIYLSFRELDIDDYKSGFKDILEEIAHKYLEENQFSLSMKRYFDNDENHKTRTLLELTKNLYSVYGVKPYIIIDEYDKPIMDNIDSPELPKFKKWITAIFGSALKDNPALEKAVLTGVTRIAKESMFSNLNNLEVYDVFRKSVNVYDNDFSLTERELTELVPAEKLPELREWYNNVRVGGSMLYNIYSVMSYLRNNCVLDAYWSSTGNMNILTDLITPGRAEQLSRMLAEPGYMHETYLEPKLDLSLLLSDIDDLYYYSLAVQAGYLTYIAAEGTEPSKRVYKVFIPNKEARHTWENQILTTMRLRPQSEFIGIFGAIANTEEFSRKLTNFISMRLSYFDAAADELEKIYHVFIFGMVLLLGYKCASNLEAGFGRYDILIEAPGFSAVIEFKQSKTLKSLAKDVQTALSQIDERRYYAPALERGLPIYKIGIACYKKSCVVKSALHDK